MSKTFQTSLAPLLALGMAAGAAQAQSRVSISGLLDVGVYRDTAKTWQVGPIQRSNIQFSGEESLGDGLKATFVLSHRFDTGNGQYESATKPFWHGQSTVGLKGAFGSVEVGRRLDAMYANDWQFDPWYYFDRVASPAWDLWHYNFPSDPQANSGTPEYGRLDNGIYYDSPTLAGFSLHLSGSPETRAGDRNKPYTAALQYRQGVFNGMVSHGRNSAGNTDTFLGLRASFSAFALMGAYDVSKAGASEAKSLTLGASYSIRQWTLKAGWGQVDLDGVKAQKVLGLGALYSLSKRTSVYADLGRKSSPAASANTFGAGIAHSF